MVHGATGLAQDWGSLGQPAQVAPKMCVVDDEEKWSAAASRRGALVTPGRSPRGGISSWYGRPLTLRRAGQLSPLRVGGCEPGWAGCSTARRPAWNPSPVRPRPLQGRRRCESSSMKGRQSTAHPAPGTRIFTTTPSVGSADTGRSKPIDLEAMTSLDDSEAPRFPDVAQQIAQFDREPRHPR